MCEVRKLKDAQLCFVSLAIGLKDGQLCSVSLAIGFQNLKNAQLCFLSLAIGLKDVQLCFVSLAIGFERCTTEILKHASSYNVVKVNNIAASVSILTFKMSMI